MSLKGEDFIPEGFLDQQIKDLEKFKKTAVKSLEEVEQSAKELDDSLKDVNATQKDGQKEIEKTEKKVDDLTKAQEKYEKSISETEQELVKLKAATSEQNRINKLTEKLNRASEGSYDKLSAQYSLNKIKLNSMSEQQRKATSSGKGLETQTKAIFEEMKGLQEATGKHSLSVGDYAGKVEELIPQFAGAAQGARALGAQLWALVANPIVALVAAVVAGLTLLFKAWQKTAGGAIFLEKAMASLGAIFDTVLGRIGSWINGEITFTDLLNNTGDAIAENIRATNNLIEARKKLEKTTSENAVAEAMLGVEIAKIEAIRDNDTKSLSVRRKAAEALAKVDVERAKLLRQQAIDEQNVATMNLAVAQTDIDRKDALLELNDALVKTQEAEAELIRVQSDAAKELEMIRLDIFEQELDLLLDITDRRKTVNERQIADERTTLNEKKKLATQNVDLIEEAYAQQIKAFEDLNGVQLDEVAILQMTGAEVFKYADSLGFAERTVNRLREVIIEKQAADQDNLDTLKLIEDAENKAAEAAQKRAEKMAQARLTEGREFIEQTAALSLSEIDILDATEEEKTRLRLEAEKRRMIALIKLNEVFGGELSDLQIQQMKNVIARIDEEITALAADDGRTDIYDLFGFNVSDSDKEALNNAGASIVSSLKSIVDANAQAANEILAIRNNELSEAQSFYDEQERLRQNGEANEAASAGRRLNSAKQAQRNALREQEKATKAQQRLETIAQASSIITASANIFQALSPGFPYTLPVAIAATGAMIGAFINSKVQAKKVAQASYGEGGDFDISGGSHSSGNDVSLGVHGGVERRVEGGEKAAIFNRKAVKRYGRGALSSIIKDINKGVFDKKRSESFHVGDDMINIVNTNSGSEELLAENKKLRHELKSAIENIPQSVQHWDEKGYRQHQMKKNTLRKNVHKENSYG